MRIVVFNVRAAFRQINGRNLDEVPAAATARAPKRKLHCEGRDPTPPYRPFMIG